MGVVNITMPRPLGQVKAVQLEVVTEIGSSLIKRGVARGVPLRH